MLINIIIIIEIFILISNKRRNKLQHQTDHLLFFVNKKKDIIHLTICSNYKNTNSNYIHVHSVLLHDSKNTKKKQLK